LVRTGHGRAAAAGAPPDLTVAEDLAEAARLITERFLFDSPR